MPRARLLCTQVGETPQLIPTLWGLCWFYLNRGALQTAREIGEQLVRLAQHAAAPTHRLEAHEALGTTLFFLGEYAARTPLELGSALRDATGTAGPGTPPWRGAWGAVPRHGGEHPVVPGLSSTGHATESGGADPGPGACPSS